MSETNTETMFALMSKLGEIASDVKHIMANQQAHDKRADDIELRVRSLEQFKWKLAGLTTLFPTVIIIVGWVLKGYFG